MECISSQWIKNVVRLTLSTVYLKTNSMITKTITSIAFFSLLGQLAFSQASDKTFTLRPPSVALGAGVLYFNGDIGKGVGVTPYSTVRGGFNLSVEERPLPYLGVSLMGMYGHLSASERSLDTVNNLNFQSTVVSGDLLVSFHLDGSVLKPDADVAPFIYTGISFLSFSPYADLKDATGNPYYYWTDGSVRNQPETSENILTAKTVNRDYTYETALDSGKYAKHTFSLPIGIGVKLRITEKCFMNIQSCYYFTFSPNIDNYKITGKNNKYIYSFVSLEYNFGRSSEDPRDVKYRSVDFSALIKDTVSTSKSRTVAVQDNTPPLSDSAIAAQHAKDTVSEDRSGSFNANPTLTTLAQQDKANNAKAGAHNLPDKFKAADKNGDGVITSQEITQSIDEFFDGTSTMSIADINSLIDYFFDQ